MKFVCKECNYRFESDLDQKDKLCPYCGEKGVEKEKSADEMLKDVD